MTKIRKSVFTFLLLGGLTLGVAAASRTDIPQSVSAAEFTQAIKVEDSYRLDTEFTVPLSEITVGGKSYETEVALRFPDGTMIRKDVITLEQKGKYTLEYRAVTEQGIVSLTKEFFVADNFFDVSGTKSSAAFGVAEHAENRPGVVASLAQGDRLKINKAIDLNGKGKDDKIAEVFVAPVEQGVADALNLVFVLTDIYDSDNYVTITAKRLDRPTLNAAWSEKTAYCTANAAEQPPTGLEAQGSGTFFWEGGTYILHRNNIYGAGVAFSMAGIPGVNSDCTDIGNPEDIAGQSLAISMDYEEKRIYVNGSIVADLDDVTIFPTSQWVGFSTGECYLSVYATSYIQNRFNVVMTEVDGIKGEELDVDFLFDTDEPEIFIDYGNYETNGFPDAVVGKAYPVPTATAYDAVDKDLPVSYRVYLNYDTNACVNVPVSDGKIIPDEPGEYTVVYTASDLSGNPTWLHYTIYAAENDSELSVRLSSAETGGETGKEITVAEATVENARGHAGLNVYALHEDSGTVETILTSGDGAYKFRPLYAGIWKIVYEYSDYIETKEETYTVTVQASALPYIAEDVTLPKYVLRGAIYDIPSLTGYVFDTGSPEEKQATVYLRDDDGNERLLTGSRFTSYADKTVTLIYRLGGGENTAEKTYTVPVVDVGYDKLELQIKDYFLGDDFTTEALSDRVFISTETQGTQSFEFVNPLQVFDFRTVFHINASANKFSKINIYLEDSADPTVAVKVSYIRNRAGNTIFTVNDGTAQYISTGDFIESSADSFRLLYSNSTRKISPSTEFGVEVTTDINGNVFNGFASGKVYMRVELAEITGRAGIEFLSINNQPLSKVTYDLLKPEISGTPVSGEKYIGDEIRIAATYASDVLDPDITFTMTVTLPDGSYAVALDGTVLDSSASPERSYTICASQYGRYTVEYVCSDLNENRTIYSYVFSVVDKEAPVITLGEGATKAGAGDTVIVKNVSCTDNYSECSLMIKIKTPDGIFLSLLGNSFVATEKGIYTVYYFVYDADYNCSVASYTVVVE